MDKMPPMGAKLTMGDKPPKFDGPPPEMPEADISMMKNCRLDLRYGDGHERQVFDIYYPEEGEGPFPVLLHMHGGGFALGDKRDFHIQELLDAVNHGYAFASCNYRRSGNAPFPAAVLDCRKFVDYLHKNAKELNIDDSRICAFGGSAGGNLSALFAMNIEKFTGEEESVDASVTCAVDWFGPTDFKKMDEQARANGISMADHDLPFSPESQYAGGPLQELDPAYLAKANPITYINDTLCPMLIQHGRKDVLVPFAQSEILVEAIEKAGLGDRIYWLPLDEAGHDDPLFKTKENLDILWAFLDKYLKGIEPEIPIEKMPLPEGKSQGASTAAFGMPPMGEFPPLGGLPLMDGIPPKGFIKPPMLSEAFKAGVKEKYFDISYADASSEQALDLWLPNERREKLCPVIIHFHGGAFTFGNKGETSAEPMLRGLDRGYAVISAEYRKSGEAIFPAMVYDAKTVVRWVRANAEKYGLDPERIALWGPSSGGWLSSFTGVTNGEEKYEGREQGYGEFSSRVHAVVEWCGPCGGFTEMDEAFKKSGLGAPDHNDPDSPESRFLGAPIPEIPELVKESCPISHIREDVVPFFIVHGGADQVVPVEQSIAFADAINAVSPGRAKLHVVPGKLHHGHPWYHEPWVAEECLDFLDEVFNR